MTAEPLQFAVLLHSGIESTHYDLLFESAPGSLLVTFRLREWPLTRDQFVTKLRDHRRLYLTFEGQIPGGDRGRVDRIADGRLLVTANPTGWSLSHPDGRPFLTLTPDPDDPGGESWWLEPAH